MAEIAEVTCPAGHPVGTRVRGRGTTCPEPGCGRTFYVRLDRTTRQHAGADPKLRSTGRGAPWLRAANDLESAPELVEAIGQDHEPAPRQQLEDNAPLMPPQARLTNRRPRLPGRDNPDPAPAYPYGHG